MIFIYVKNPCNTTIHSVISVVQDDIFENDFIVTTEVDGVKEKHYVEADEGAVIYVLTDDGDDLDTIFVGKYDETEEDDDYEEKTMEEVVQELRDFFDGKFKCECDCECCDCEEEEEEMENKYIFVPKTIYVRPTLYVRPSIYVKPTIRV